MDSIKVHLVCSLSLVPAMNYFLVGIGMEMGYKTYQILVRFVNWIRGAG